MRCENLVISARDSSHKYTPQGSRGRSAESLQTADGKETAVEKDDYGGRVKRPSLTKTDDESTCSAAAE